MHALKMKKIEEMKRALHPTYTSIVIVKLYIFNWTSTFYMVTNHLKITVIEIRFYLRNKRFYHKSN